MMRRTLPSGAANTSGRAAHARTSSARTTSPAPGARMRDVRTRAVGMDGGGRLQAEDDATHEWMLTVYTQALHDAPSAQELHVQSLVTDRMAVERSAFVYWEEYGVDDMSALERLSALSADVSEAMLSHEEVDISQQPTERTLQRITALHTLLGYEDVEGLQEVLMLVERTPALLAIDLPTLTTNISTLQQLSCPMQLLGKLERVELTGPRSHVWEKGAWLAALLADPDMVEVVGVRLSVLGRAVGGPSSAEIDQTDAAVAMVATCPQLLMLDERAVAAAMRRLARDADERGDGGEVEMEEVEDSQRSLVRADPKQLLWAALQGEDHLNKKTR